MRYIKIHKEGRTILGTVLFILVLLNFYVYTQHNSIILVINFIISFSVFFFFAYFFRNPSRKIKIEDSNLVVAPADGTIVVVEPVDELEHFGDKRIQVSIFMSVVNVHANWFPVNGTVVKSLHHKGRHMAAFLPKSSTENERSTVVIETPDKTQILLRQIAGALARRIVTYAKEGKPCHVNEQMGFIKFGSRVDLFFPIGTEIFVQVGDCTRGNETIIARLNDKKQ